MLALRILILSVVLYGLGKALVIKFEECCKNPETTGRNLLRDVSKHSPYYAVAVPRTPKTELIDNICYTYFENENGDLLNAISVVFKNGASEQFFYNVCEYDNKDGVTCSRGPDCTFLDYAIHDICCKDVLILYRCYVSMDACSDYDVDVGRIPLMDVRIALATSPLNKCDCLDCLLETLACDDRFCGNDFILLPNQRCPQCVTEYNCNDAIRADCAVGEICVNDCCRLTPHLDLLPPPLPFAFGPPAAFPPLPPVLAPAVPRDLGRKFINPMSYFFDG